MCQYVELDDENVFLCTGAFFFIFSRQTHRMLLMFPSFFDRGGEASVGLSLRYEPTFLQDDPSGSQVGAEREVGDDGGAATVRSVLETEPEGSKPTTIRQIRPDHVRTGLAEPRYLADFASEVPALVAQSAFGFDA